MVENPPKLEEWRIFDNPNNTYKLGVNRSQKTLLKFIILIVDQSLQFNLKTKFEEWVKINKKF